MTKKKLLISVALLLCALLFSLAAAESYENVYGRTDTKIRVRASASTSAAVTDNIVSRAVVYITETKTSGDTTFVHLRYRASDGSIQSGWSAQKSGKSTYIRILKDSEARKTYGVSGGEVPKKRVGTFKQTDQAASSSSGSSSSSSASSSSSSSSSSSASGLSASQIKDLQTKLKALGMYSGSVTGNIGTRTKAAIRAFQKKYGLSADGIPGEKTLAKLNSVYDAKSFASSSAPAGDVSPASTVTVNVSGKVYNLNWFRAKDNGIFKKLGLTAGQNATLRDLTTGKSLKVRIQSAGNHLDVEPRTASDTAVLCAVYGVSSASSITSKTCWQRRPMLLTTSQGYKLVCSIYGVPHGTQEITDNNFDGQFCLHFLNSKTHGSGKVDSGHQQAIQKAVELVGSSKVKKLEDL